LVLSQHSDWKKYHPFALLLSIFYGNWGIIFALFVSLLIFDEKVAQVVEQIMTKVFNFFAFIAMKIFFKTLKFVVSKMISTTVGAFMFLYRLIAG
jgi:hypothetical protein